MLPPEGFQNLPTPCYVVDVKRFDKGILTFQDALSAFFKEYSIGYSVKTNPLPWLMQRAGRLGCMAEVVSEDEYLLAVKCGFTPDRIIYNGLMKSEATVMECLEGGGIVNVDTWREIEWLLERRPSGRGVGLRIKSDYAEVAPDECTGVNDDSRFGFSESGGELQKAIEALTGAGIEIEGLHIHRTTHTRSVSYYVHAAEYAASIVRKYSLKLKYLDIGGGFFGIFPGKPRFEEYAGKIYDVLSANGMSGIKLIVEPGSSVSAWAMKIVSSVIDVRHGGDERRYVTLDVSRNDVDPFFRKRGYMTDILYCDDSVRRLEPMQIIGGYTCLEDDRLYQMEGAPALKRGDKIVFNRVGAYTLTLSGLFIRLFPSVYVYEEGEYRCVRRRWNVEDMISADIPANE